MRRAAIVLIAVFGVMALMGASCPKTDNIDARTLRGEDKDLFERAELLFDGGEYEQAVSAYQNVIEEFPMSEYANRSEFRIGQCLFKLGRTDDATRSFKRFVANNRQDSDVVAAQDYIIQIQGNSLANLLNEYKEMVNGYEQQNYRLDTLNRYLRKSVDSEVIYIEMHLEADRLYVKIGSQTLYEYPIVSGKGYRRLAETGRVKNFNTPKGIRQIENIVKNPIWYRPNWYWEEKGMPVPEELTMKDRAVHGTLGPYKLGFGEGFYIHGTRSGRVRPGKFSHGCVRMNNKDLKQLVALIEKGTMLYIY